ncbi:hypothetical protein CPAR01_01325 [Colletotrichum paranaense]|uniref:Uncharacterized protein n=1 Tax=Colletotrichum paranaense TaxID=1914294 RepID=A0ABQ9T6E4_9PEZI|nr:uncharacterized protein CPAR01_01325 [Colletotrichum paranaense]KAK1547358.1 hypothetical protein CPAR01_01325 [Colletotrichum paranaense]
MINPIIPMQVRVHSETGLSTPGPRGREGGEGEQHHSQCLKSETTRRTSKDASTHSKTTSPSLTVGHAEKPQSQQESIREPGLAAVARPKERDYLTGFGTLGTRRYGKGKSPTAPNISLLPAACSHPSHPSLWESSSNPTRTNPVLAAKHEAQITTCPYSVPTYPCNASAVQTAVNPTPWPIWYTYPRDVSLQGLFKFLNSPSSFPVPRHSNE